MLTVRPSRLEDFDALMELARLSGPGFTSLPDDEPLIWGRLEKSQTAFHAPDADAAGGAYLLMLEQDGAVVGCAAVKAGTGVEKPFFNYRVLTIAQASAAGGRRFDMDVLVLVNEFAGATEVGSLFIKAEARGGGAGRLLAQSRYLLIAAAPHRFSERVIAELRGQVDAEGHSPFWEELGRRFFRMTFDEADRLSAVSDNQFILDLMPKYPIYVDLLGEAAQGAVGAVHPDGVAAMRLLEWEGFRHDRVVDIFDGGPLVAAPRDQIRTVRESRSVTVRAGEPGAQAASVFLSTDTLPGFQTCRTRAGLSGTDARVNADVLAALGLEEGARARVWVRE